MFLACEVLAYDFQENPHAEMFQSYLKKEPGVELFSLDKEVKKRMTLWPRGCFKTSSVEVEIVQLLLNYPDIRICILSGSERLAKNILKAAKSWFDRPTERFKALFPEYCAPERRGKVELIGSAEEFTVPARKRVHLREPSVCVSTAKSVKAGAHFDVIFIDDLVNEQNYRSLMVQNDCFEDYKHIGPLLDPGGYLYVTGTMYTHQNCPENTYVWIQELARKEMQETGKNVWRFSIKSCWQRYCKTCNHFDTKHDLNKAVSPCLQEGCECKRFVDSGKKEILFPQTKTRDGRTIGHTVEFLESELNEKGEEFFVTQYENRLLPATRQVFPPELLDRQTLYHLKQIPAVAPTIIVGDLSYFGDTKRDESVFLVARVQHGQLYIIDDAAGNWSTQTVAEEMFRLMMKYRPRVIFIERTPAWESFDYAFKAYAVQKQIQQLPIEWIKMSMEKNAKLRRIAAVQAPLAQQRLWLFAGMSGYKKLYEQLRKHPRSGKTDDYADCLGLLCAAPTGYHLSSMAPPKSTLPDYIAKMHEQNNPFRLPEDPLDHSPLGAGLVG